MGGIGGWDWRVVTCKTRIGRSLPVTVPCLRQARRFGWESPQLNAGRTPYMFIAPPAIAMAKKTQ